MTQAVSYAWRADDQSPWTEIRGGNVELPHKTVSDGFAASLTDEERAEEGFVEVVETPRPTGLAIKSADAAVEDVDGVPTRVWAVEERSLEEARAIRRAQAEAHYDGLLAVGFPVPALGEGETLQLRNEHDRTNWLALKDSCNDAIAAGLGAELCPLPIRTTANVNHALTFADAAQLMRDLRAWGSAMMGALWAVKAQIDAAQTIEALEAIDLGAGYPEA